jgi:hypothetical protein
MRYWKKNTKERELTKQTTVADGRVQQRRPASEDFLTAAAKLPDAGSAPAGR